MILLSPKNHSVFQKSSVWYTFSPSRLIRDQGQSKGNNMGYNCIIRYSTSFSLTVCSILGLGLCCFLQSCTSSHATNLSAIPEKRAFPAQAMVTSSSTERFDQTSRFDTYKYAVEEGRLNEFAYRLFKSDGSGSITGSANLSTRLHASGSWSISTSYDMLADHVSVSLSKDDLYVYVLRDTPPIFSVGLNHYPNTSQFIRPGGGKIIEAASELNFTQAQSVDLYESMKSARSVVTRYTRWPNRNIVETQTDIAALTEAITIARWIVNHYRPPHLSQQ